MDTNLKIFRNDDPIDKILANKYSGMILSPGPDKPENSGNLNSLISYYEDKLPILGICLGHQALGTHFGARLIKALKPMHGKRSSIRVQEDYLFRLLPARFQVVRYHSLILEDLKGGIEPIAFSDQGEIMAIRHPVKNIRGVQFHPEAVLSEFGFDILKNWISYNQIY
jgi:anthranilate synthase component 2